MATGTGLIIQSPGTRAAVPQEFPVSSKDLRYEGLCMHVIQNEEQAGDAVLAGCSVSEMRGKYRNTSDRPSTVELEGVDRS